MAAVVQRMSMNVQTRIVGRSTKSIVGQDSVQVYLGGEKVLPIKEPEAAAHAVAFKPFMTYWKRFFKWIQVFYITFVFLTL